MIYGSTNWLAWYRGDVYRIYLEWELAIPLLPSMIWIYASIVPLMLLPAFYLDTRQLDRLAKQLALAMLIAGAVFLVFPTTTGYTLATETSRGIGFIRSIDLPYNAFPSLHVALSAIVMLHLRPVFVLRGRLFLGIWVVALVASVIFTHQHHLADVPGAALLVWVCSRLSHSDRR